jgi:hypothetical protein
VGPGSGWVWEISPEPGFDPRHFQLLASRYNDYVILHIDIDMKFGVECDAN